MSHRTTKPGGSRHSGSRGNRRTRGGPGRHNRRRVNLDTPHAAVRICLGCNRPFKSRGPWNRFCGRCRDPEIEEENNRSYHVPRECRQALRDELDNF
jgi:hypothetical protein